MSEIFFILSILTSSICSFVLYRLYKFKRYLLVKPSFWFLVFFNFQIQWSSTIYSSEIFERLDEPYIFYLLTQILPLGFSFLVQKTFLNSAKNIYIRLLKTNKIIKVKEYDFELKVMFCLSVIIVGIFLLNTPFTKTGLYQTFSGSDALESTLAREESLKNAPGLVRYTYVFFNKVLAVLSVVIISRGAYQNFKARMWTKVFGKVLLIFALAVFSSLSGARSHGVYVLLSAIVTILFLVDFDVPFLTIICTVLGLLFVPVVLQINKFQGNLDLDTILITYEEILLRRSFKIPMETGLNWLKYVEDNGFWGINGISFLKSFSGDNYINVSNFMMNQSSDRLSVDTGLMNTSFIFSYFSYMGYFAFMLYPLLFLLLDTALVYVSKLHYKLTLPAVVLICLCSINLVNTEYHTIFLSYGYLTGVVFLTILSKKYSFKTFN